MCEFVCVQNLLCTSMRSSVVVVAVRMQKTVQVLFHVGDAATFLLVLFFLSSFSFRSSPTKRVCRCASSLSIFMSGQFMFEPKWKSVEPSEAYLLAPPDIHALTHTHRTEYNAIVALHMRTKDNIFRLTASRCQSNARCTRENAYISRVSVACELPYGSIREMRVWPGSRFRRRTHAIFQCLVRSFAVVVILFRYFSATCLVWVHFLDLNEK